ncbi:MAG: CHRD domain-containing protein [Thermoleophilaceae bacterium]
MRKSIAALLTTIVAVLAVASMAFAASKAITVNMNGKQETPAGSPTGKGTAKVTLNSSTGKVCFRLSWTGIGTPTAAHIHKGAKGKAGPVVIPFFGGTPKHSACVKAAKSLVAAIIKKPGSYYVNVHTAKFPGGAIRAQL